MSITVDIKPEVQAELSRQAATRGVDVGTYAARLLEDAALVVSSDHSLRQEQLDSTLRELAQFSHKIPQLPDEALSRAAFYQDHD
jgi:hypothetical protein